MLPCSEIRYERMARRTSNRTALRIVGNALEDVRIENELINTNKFPAARSVLSTLVNHVYLEQVGKKVCGDKVKDAPYAACVLGRVDNGYSVPAAHALVKNMSPAVKQLVDMARAGLPSCYDTQ